MAPKIEHHGGHSRSPVTRGETRCLGGVSVSCLASRTRHKCPRHNRHYIGSVSATTQQEKGLLTHFIYRFIDDVLSINNPDFENYLGQMYPPELEIKDTTESNTSASYLDLLLSIGRNGIVYTSLYTKHDDFNFHITNFPFLSSNIPSSPAYGVFYLTPHPIRKR